MPIWTNACCIATLSRMARTRLFSTAEAADQLGVSPPRVRQIADDLDLGQLIGHSLVFTTAEVARMKKRRTFIGRPPAKRS